MRINVYSLIEGAKKARGVAVIIDVFRAFSFECYLARNNAEKIIPVASKELAYELKRKNPDYILAGERRGVMLPGFDFGNSPAQIENVDFTGKTVVHTTSAGTQGLENAVNAREVLTGSLCNAGAIAEYIKRYRAGEEISLVRMGNDGILPAEEDDLCAEYLKNLLEDKKTDISERIERLKTTGGERFFDAARQDVMPERDFFLSTAIDKFDFVLRFKYDSDGLGYIRKIDINPKGLI